MRQTRVEAVIEPTEEPHIALEKAARSRCTPKVVAQRVRIVLITAVASRTTMFIMAP